MNAGDLAKEAAFAVKARTVRRAARRAQMAHTPTNPGTTPPVELKK